MRKSIRNAITQSWYYYFSAALFILQAAVFLIFREESYLQVHDNLDLFMAHYEMIRKQHGFFAQNVTMPMLHGINRDLLGSEWNLYNLMYILFPGFAAYLIGYALKIAIGFSSFLLLAKKAVPKQFDDYKSVFVLTATAFSLIPVFPTYGIAFTSVPLLIYLLLCLQDAGKGIQIAGYLGLIFLYPFLSYFSYHGFFILCYMSAAILILWAKNKRFPFRLFGATAILSLGYMVWEYRLFRAMLFDDTVTIRTTMEHGQVTLREALSLAISEFTDASFHSEDTHTFLVLPVVLFGVLLININYIRNKQGNRMGREPLNGILLLLIMNSVNYGLYFFAPYRETVERLVPKLTGFEFSRTSYFNPFLWYAAFALVLVRAAQAVTAHKKGKQRLLWGVQILALAAPLLVMFVPQMYNDFYATCYNQAYRLIKQKETSTVNYREFYSAALFEEVKAACDYQGEWSCAYGLHPSVLNYNGIATLDGYLGMYPQSYKEQWERVIAPAAKTSPSLAAYFTDWGARVWLMSAADENTYAHLRNLKLTDHRLIADMEELRKLDCRYIFSRIRFSNEEEAGLVLQGSYTHADSPYTIYVYVPEEIQ